MSTEAATPKPYHISVVDDEASLRDNLNYALEREGYNVSTYPNGQDAWDAYNRIPPDLYVLDILMPRMDGLELCKRLRKIDTHTPVIFLSSRDEELDKVMGLEIGGDDYICKPFSVRELIARIKAVLRRIEGGSGDEPSIELGPLFLSPGSYKASWAGKALTFTLTEYRLLTELMNTPGMAQSRSALYNAAFPEDQFINERAVDSHIKRIRRKLELAGAPRTILETVYGLGYRLGVQE